MPNIRVEAENLVLALNSTGYVVESGAFASGGQLIRLPNDGTVGTITHDFDLTSGTYDIVIGYYDENDGLSPYSLKQKSSNQDWVNLDSWVADKKLGDSRASAKNFVTRTISGVNLTTGDQVQVQGQLHTGEVARIDYIEYIPISILPPPTPDTTAPTATATANDSTLNTGSNNSYNFTVTYTDDKGVKVSSLDSHDIRVTGPNGFDQLASFVSVDSNSDGTPRTATYSINAPGGSWDSNEAGNYSVVVADGQVQDTSDNSVVSSQLDTFSINLESPPVDTTAPTATATANDTTLNTGSNNSYSFTVTYADDKGVKVSSLDSHDIRVTGPNGFDQLASFVSVDTNSDGTPRTATYSINAPGGSWDSNEAGSYSVVVADEQVQDTSDNSVVSSELDTFSISLESSPPPASVVKIEAEDMTLAGYKIESGIFASAGEYIGLLSPNNTGNATQAFSGVSSLYDIVVGYFDESDGKSPLSISVGGNKISEWVANQSPGGTRASATNFLTKTIQGVQVNSGDEIKLGGILEAGENARFDYVEFIPVTPITPPPPPTPDTTAPTATATANNITLSTGSNNSYNFTVTYSDDKGVKVSSLDSHDIRVTGPNGFDQLASFVSVDNNSDGTPRTATYSINAPGGSWDSNEAGNYSVVVADGQVQDTSDNSVVSSQLDTFSISLESPPVDTTAPTATATANDSTLNTGSNNSYNFTVTYSDDKGVKVSSLDSQDIRVTGPNGFDQLASFVSVDTNSDGTPRTATYSINAPGGSWDSNEAGSYSVVVADGQVKDTSDNSVVSSQLDTFQVDVQTSPSTPMDIVTIEAEAMTLAGGYRIESGIFASGGKFIGLSSSLGSTGTATTEDFSGVSGAYDIVVRYFDESDGQSQISLGVQGTTVGTWTANQSLGASNASAKTLTEIVFKNVQVNQNDKIEINGAINSGENARIDRIELIPAGDNIAPSADLTVNNLTVTSGDSQAYTFTVEYSDNLGVDASTIDSQDVRVTGPNGFNQLATFVSSNLNSDGKVATATYKINAPGGSWNLKEAGTYTVAMQSNQVLDRINNPVASGTLGTFEVSVNSNGDTADYSQAAKGVNVNLELGLGYIPDKDQTLKIMPLGDSITAGKENSSQLEAQWQGYRIGLWQRFESLGVPIDFVGSQSNGTANLPDKNHQGHAGWTINDLKNGRSTVPGSGVNNWIPASDPDVVLLMVGTNDASGSPLTMRDRLSSLVDSIIAQSSFDNGDLLVSTIAPINPKSSYYSSRMQNVKDYNALIPAVVDSKPTSENVKFVDMWTGPNPILETDITAPPADGGLHPTASGYEKMANYWFDAILDATGQKQVLDDKTQVKGSAYDDVIVGNAADNYLAGGEGKDKITGGSGADTFVYKNPNQGQDTLTDFTPGQGDIFSISASGFGAGLVAGTALSTTASSQGVFTSGSSLNYLGDMAHFFYNTATGLLGFDPDGNKSQSLITLATLTGKPALTANQFVIV